ncbi:MAG: hypothetical protein ABEJ72_01450 [Candidatus Aenigmatarchaeota archaeon]
MTYLSLVTAARNDDYGGNQLQRMQCFLDSVLAFSDEYSADIEVIIVEWNPPEDQPLLKDELSNNYPESSTVVRFIQVANKIHESLPNSDEMPLFEYIAKNAGIKRAKGDYILATNPDLIYNKELIRFFSEKKLQDDKFYRINRYDVGELVPLNLTVEERLKFCSNNTTEIRRRSNYWSKDSLYNYMKDLVYDHIFDLRKAKVNLQSLLTLKSPSSIYELHCHSSGGFLLTAKENWYDLRGYPELDLNFHIDSFGVVNMAASGLEQEILENPIKMYHPEHETYHEERPQLDWGGLVRESQKMLREGEPRILNDEDWGLGDRELQEYKLRR